MKNMMIFILIIVPIPGVAIGEQVIFADCGRAGVLAIDLIHSTVDTKHAEIDDASVAWTKPSKTRDCKVTYRYLLNRYTKKLRSDSTFECSNGNVTNFTDYDDCHIETPATKRAF